jgi:prolyl-tRNA editing enzyme YbaK/EbsC (Cys-tRNA(Pro) deacylase)
MMCGAELSKLPEGAQKVVAFLQSIGHTQQPRMLEDAARTAQQAADALGVELGQIAKSIVFRRKSDDAPVLVITSGDKRVDEIKVQALVCENGTKLGRADAEFVKLKTGFAIGGVAPVAHLEKPVTLLDKELFRFESVWAAAGHPNAVFEITPHALQLFASAPVADVTVSIL